MLLITNRTEKDTLKVLQWLSDYNYLDLKDKAELITKYVSKKSFFEVIKWIHSKNYEISMYACKNALCNNRKDIADWIHDKQGCIFSKYGMGCLGLFVS